ncbi:MAG TPA: sugar ABC transporter permease [Alphaproteobacteria bacterium]
MTPPPAEAVVATARVGLGGRARVIDDENWLGAFLIAPAVIYIVLLVGFPFCLAVLYSLTDVTVGNQALDFVGLRNYAGIIESSTFWVALRNTIVFTLVSQAIVVVLAKILALALIQDFPGKWLVRLLILLPWIAPISLGTIGWLWMLDPVYSILNWVLRAIGWLGPSERYIWLGQPDLAMGSIIAVHVWRLLPLATVILIAGLTAIPKDVLEAAAVDGAGFWRRLFQITIPLMQPIMLVAVLFGVVFTVTDMVVIFVLTRGGPYDTTQVLASWAYFTGVQGGDLSEGAAISLFMFPVLAAIAIVMLRMARRAEVT